MMRVLSMIAAAILAVGATGAGGARAAELVMFEEAGCGWCQRWHEEIGPGYPKSSEGRVAPLRRVDFRQAVPSDIRLLHRINSTPTFVLVEGGEERGRMLGYPGAQFFYPMLDTMIQRLAKTPSEAVPPSQGASADPKGPTR